MKFRGYLAIAAAFLILTTQNAFAIEGGKDASGSPYVVPIYTELDSSNATTCTGAVLSQLIVVTAAHCVLDSSGLLSNKVFIGEPGSPLSMPFDRSNAASAIQITSNFKNGINNTVGNDDLAFITLTKKLTTSITVGLASESDYSTLKSSNGTVRVIGYGSSSDSSGQSSGTPYYFDGTLSQQAIQTKPNSGYLQSSGGHICKGDSGSPVLSFNVSSVTLIGIVTGGNMNINCVKPSTPGSYLALYTIVGRYANLAFASAISAMDSAANSADSVAELQKNLTDSMNRLNIFAKQSADLQIQIETLTKNFQTCITAAKKIIVSKRGKLPSNC